MSRAIAETMPRVTVPPRPKGLPTAMTSSPTRTLSLSPSGSCGQVAGVDLDQREVALLVGADDLGVELALVGEADLHRLGVVDDVVVGDDEAVVVDDEARAERDALGAVLLRALRPPGLPPISGMPKRRMNSSKGEPGPKGEPSGIPAIPARRCRPASRGR